MSRYWAALSKLERELTGAPPGTPPSFDYTDFVCEDLSTEAGPGSLQLAPREDVVRLLLEKDWDGDAVLQALLP